MQISQPPDGPTALLPVVITTWLLLIYRLLLGSTTITSVTSWLEEGCFTRTRSSSMGDHRMLLLEPTATILLPFRLILLLPW
ncbi:hypothetical protein Goari_010348 [Gossypium aridum]|uniref:Uncharacterized protein n=1 Tax=Gossypium aridum TaxID=34290 RepID=A0A7J8Y1B2_GOSAI|nr:hypothetical protein [Gossypium aridum]